MLRNRPLSIDLADERNADGDGGRRGYGRRDDFDDDRTAGDWRRGGGTPPYDAPDGPPGYRQRRCEPPPHFMAEEGEESKSHPSLCRDERDYPRRDRDGYPPPRGGREYDRGPPPRSHGYGHGWGREDRSVWRGEREDESLVVMLPSPPAGTIGTLTTGTGGHRVATTMDHDTTGIKSTGVVVTVTTTMGLGVTADLVVAMTMALGGDMTMAAVGGHPLSGHASSFSRAAGLARRRAARGAAPSSVGPNRWTRQHARRRLRRDWRGRGRRRNGNEHGGRCVYHACLLTEH